jgi:hypothetical protein
MADLMRQNNNVEVLNQVVFNQAAFRFGNSDALTTDVVERVQKSGECWVQTADWNGRTIMRFSVCNHTTTPADIDRAAKAVLTALNEAQR